MIVDIPADLLLRRPDVRAVELQLAAQSALIRVNVAALYPSINLTGLIGLSATSIPSVATMPWAIGPRLIWNIPDYGRLTNQVLVQDARFQQLYEQYLDKVLSAARELDDAAISFANGRIQIDIVRDSVQAARRSLDIAMIQYREGLVDFQRVLFNQQEAMVATQGGILQSLITVYKALGGGWRAGRTRPAVDDAPAATMGQGRDWKNLLQAPPPRLPRRRSCRFHGPKCHEPGNRYRPTAACHNTACPHRLRPQHRRPHRLRARAHATAPPSSRC